LVTEVFASSRRRYREFQRKETVVTSETSEKGEFRHEDALGEKFFAFREVKSNRLVAQRLERKDLFLPIPRALRQLT
jgi:hypothetical protein